MDQSQNTKQKGIKEETEITNSNKYLNNIPIWITKLQKIILFKGNIKEKESKVDDGSSANHQGGVVCG